MNNGTILKQRYKILRHIGSGGMAEVYLAEDLLLNRQVAIKILRDQFNDDKTLLNQFKHEAFRFLPLLLPRKNTRVQAAGR